MRDKVLVVNEKDEFIREEDGLKCHLGEGVLHRAFDVIVLKDGKVLLTKRSDKKLLWPGYWDGSVASHVKRGESYEKAARRRLKEEIGIDSSPEFLFKFRYKSRYKNVGVEYEVCAILRANCNGKLKVNLDEISEYKFVDIDKVKEDVKINPGRYCPWFILALERINI